MSGPRAGHIHKLQAYPPLHNDQAVAFVQLLTGCGAGSSMKETFDYTALRDITTLKAFKGLFTCSLKVSTRVQNRYGGLHGGCTATIVDTIGTAVLLTVQERSGVSLNIHVDYLSPAALGSWVDIEATVVKAGRNISIAKVELRDRESGKVVAVGTHTKFVGRADAELAREVQSKQPTALSTL